MRKTISLAAALAAAFWISTAVARGQAGGGPALSWRFIGASQTGADTNATKLKKIWNLPATRALRDYTIGRLALLPRHYYSAAFGAVDDRASIIRPLLEEIVASESVGEYYRAKNGAWSGLLAVRLTEERSQRWNNLILESLKAWKFGSITNLESNGHLGWTMLRFPGPTAFHFIRVGSWCLVAMGSDGVPRLESLVREIKASGRPKACEKEGWLSGTVDLPQLAPHWPLGDYIPFLPAVDPPAIAYQLTSQADNVRSKIVLRYPLAPAYRLEAWKLPENTIRDPVISFTAMQGIAPWLSRQKFLEPYLPKPGPNQACLWANAQVPFQSYCALATPQAATLVDRAASRLIPSVSTNLTRQKLGELIYRTNELVWAGLPLLGPSMRPVTEPAGEFVLFNLFPPPPGTNPAPPELFAQINGRTNLIYYDWEITQERVMQLRLLGQVMDVIVPRIDPNPEIDKTNTLGHAWIQSVAPLLENTATEALITSPWEIVISRKSPLGLTALEMVLLTRWLDQPNFPVPGLRLPVAKPSNKPAANPSDKPADKLVPKPANKP